MIGKRVTLFGTILTDVGPGTVNGDVTESVRVMVDERDPDGFPYLVLADVIDALPTTIRREDLWDYLTGRKEWP